MAVWLVRAGKNGLYENHALEGGFALIGFWETGDLTQVQSKDEIKDLLRDRGGDNPNTISNHANQIWAFVKTIQVGDIIALPLKGSASVAFGRVTGDYYFVKDSPEGMRHRRPVQWVREDTPRSSIGQDLLYSLGAFLTVCQIKRNDAEQRIEAVMNGQPDPGLGSRLEQARSADDLDTDDAEALDLERYGRDRIGSIISRKFAGHELTRLVNAILEAEGYQTLMAPPGPDRGVDILAGGGPMGFDPPRICVQVKSGAAEASMLRDLRGTMHNVGANQGLFVAWGGFNRNIRDEERRTFFSIRLWDSDDLIARLIAVYDRLPASIRDDIPLTQVWTVVEEDA